MKNHTMGYFGVSKIKVLKFEIKKILKQKNLYWIIAVVLLFTCGIFIQSMLEKENMGDRALEEFEPFVQETEQIGEDFRIKQLNNELSETEEKQYDHIKGILTSFFYWKSAIQNENWGEIPTYENDFLTHVHGFENYGGIYTPLPGMEREKRIAKNEWMVEHRIAYEDEAFPTSPHLLLKESSKVLYGVFGVVILLLFFGNFITSEKEQNTWHTLKTQPIPKWKLYVAKYMSTLFIMVVFLILAAGISIFIPLIFTDESLSLLYPQLVMTGENFTFISTAHYISRAGLLFICATAITFSIVLFISKWVKSSFAAITMTLFILIVGYILTDMNTVLQSIWNPFQVFRMESIIETIPKSTDWLYLVISFSWNALLLLCAILISDKEVRLFSFSQINKPFHGGNTQSKKRTVWNIILFERRKFGRKGLLLQATIFITLLVILGSIVLSEQADEKEKFYIQNLSEKVDSHKNIISVLEDLMETIEEVVEDDFNREEAMKGVNEAIAFEQESISFTKDAIEGHERRNWRQLYEYQLYQNELSSLDNEYMQGISPLSKLTLEASIAEKHWLKERDIQPIYSGEFVQTIFDDTDLLEAYATNWFVDTGRVDASGLYSLYYYFEKYIYFLPIILFLFLVGTGFADERGKKDTMRLLMTQPIKKNSLLNGKVTHSVFVSLMSCMGLLLFVVFIGNVFDRFGDWNYPILHYDHKSIVEATNYTGSQPLGMDVGYHFIPLGEMLIRNIALFICVFAFLITLSHVLSIWMNNKLNVIASVMIIVVLGYVVSTNMLSSIAYLLPFTYFDIPRITNGEMSIVFDHPAINVPYGITILLLSAIILWLFGNIVLKRKPS